MDGFSNFKRDEDLLSRHQWVDAAIKCLNITLTIALVLFILLFWKQQWSAQGGLLIRISGESMNPTLSDGDLLYYASYDHFDRQDIVCLTVPPKGETAPGVEKGDQFIKRIIGLPGETVSIKSDGSIFIDGVFLWEPYINMEEKDKTYQGQYENRITEITLGKNEYFVLGDNRKNSLDSRAFGPVPEDLIHGSAAPSPTSLVFKNFSLLILLGAGVPLLFYQGFGWMMEVLSCAWLRKKENSL